MSDDAAAAADVQDVPAPPPDEQTTCVCGHARTDHRGAFGYCYEEGCQCLRFQAMAGSSPHSPTFDESF